MDDGNVVVNKIKLREMEEELKAFREERKKREEEKQGGRNNGKEQGVGSGEVEEEENGEAENQDEGEMHPVSEPGLFGSRQMVSKAGMCQI